jgi:hypothetical protein
MSFSTSSRGAGMPKFNISDKYGATYTLVRTGGKYQVDGEIWEQVTEKEIGITFRVTGETADSTIRNAFAEARRVCPKG